MRNIPSYFISYRKFLLYSKGDSKEKNKGTDPEVKNIVSCEKSQKMLHALQKTNMRVFYAKWKISLS